MTETERDVVITDFYNEYRRYMLHYARRFLNNPEDREDVVQKTIFECFLKLHTFRGDSSLKTWITTSVGNACKNFIKNQNALKRKHIPVHLEKDHMENLFTHPGPDALDECIENDIREKALRSLKKASRRFSSKRYDIMYKTITEQKSAKQISEEMDTNPITVKTNISRGRKALREVVEKICSD